MPCHPPETWPAFLRRIAGELRDTARIERQTATKPKDRHIADTLDDDAARLDAAANAADGGCND